MKIIVGILAVLSTILVLGFIFWLTGFSFGAFLAGFFLLGLACVLGADKAKIVTLHPVARTLLGWGVMFCLAIIVWLWATRKTETQPDFEKEGLVPAVIKPVGVAGWQVLFGKPDPTPTPAAQVQTYPPAPVVAPEYPTSGEGHATKETGLKAWLDPKKTHVHPSRPARYTFVQDPTLFWDDCAGVRVESNSSKHVRVWLEEMPAGEYIISPINDGDRVFFRWWQ